MDNFLSNLLLLALSRPYSASRHCSYWSVQDSMVQQHQAQIDQMQKQFNDMMDVRRQQQQAAIEQQRKLAEDAFKLQQQHLHVNNLRE